MNAVLQKRERGMHSNNEQNFITQFDDLPPRAAAAIAIRAAMRALPVLTAYEADQNDAFAYWRMTQRACHVLSIFRCLQVSNFVSTLTKSDSAAKIAFNAASAADLAQPPESVSSAIFARASAAAAQAARAAAFANLDRRDAAIEAACAAVAASAQALGARASRAEAFAEYLARSNSAEAATAESAAQDAAQTAAAIIDAVRHDINWIIQKKSLWLNRLDQELTVLVTTPLWGATNPTDSEYLWIKLKNDLRKLYSGMRIWIDWYQNRLDGKPYDWEIERQWAYLSEARLAQSAPEINAYLESLRDGSLSKQLKRVRAIFVGHGEVGKTSIIRALHNEDVIAGSEAMTRGITIKDAIHEQAGVFTRVTNFNNDDLTVHFWDFGGQVMAHATHQFFLRSKCLYVVVLAGRAERNPNEEAEYWLEYVRAFGDNAPVLIVGNKADMIPVNLDLKTLREKYPNIIDFYSVSCTHAKDTFKEEFALFRRRFEVNLKVLGERSERFSPSQFNVLKTIEEVAERGDFLRQSDFDAICKANGIAMEGPGGREGLLDIFDKLGIVMHFANLPFLTDYVLNPRWLTYGVYTIMYSEEAKVAKGRLSESDIVAILKSTIPSVSDGRILHYPPERCRLIADAMIAFRVAYRLGADRLVIPALLPPEQPEHNFQPENSLAFRFDFGGFLPRHVMPALVVEHFQDIAKVSRREIVWQNGALFRPQRYQAEAFVRADYHTRTLKLLVKGIDAALYLGILRESILSTLETMPHLPVKEEVELRANMRVEAIGPTPLDGSVWMPYKIIQTAQRSRLQSIVGPDGIYDMDRILAAMPVRPGSEPADVFLSYSSKDSTEIKKLSANLENGHITVWYDRALIAGLPYRDVLQKRIETVKAVVVLWTENSIGSKWVRAEADLADKHNKLICLRDPKLEPKRIPMPFAANDHIIPVGDMPGLIAALALRARSRVSEARLRRSIAAPHARIRLRTAPAASVNPKLVNFDAPDLFLVQFILKLRSIRRKTRSVALWPDADKLL